MAQKKQSEKVYKILQTEGTHLVYSKDTKGAIRALEFSDDSNRLVGPAELIEADLSSLKPENNLTYSLLTKIIISAAEIIIPKVADYLADKTIESLDSWLNNKKHSKKRLAKKTASNSLKALQVIDHSSNETLLNNNILCSLSVDIDIIYSEYHKNADSLDIQKELIEIYLLSVLQLKKIYHLFYLSSLNSVVKDFPSNNQMNAFSKKLCDSYLLDSINSILSSDLITLYEWEKDILMNITSTSTPYFLIQRNSLTNYLSQE